MPSHFGPSFDIILAWAKSHIDFTFSTKPRIFYQGQECLGLTVFQDGKKPLVILSRRLKDFDHKILILLHELGHVSKYAEHELGNSHESQHDSVWGQFYARWYVLFYQELNPDIFEKTEKLGEGK